MFTLLIGALAVLSATIMVKKTLRYHQLSQFSRSHECQAPPIERPYDYFGIVKIYTSTRHLLKKTALANMIDLFDKYGQTFASRIMTQTVFFTCEPRNIKHVLVTGFSDYDNSTVRVHLFKPITEHGIFAVDGQEWKVARAVYRDQFSHTRSILDLEQQEYHFQNFLRQIPSSGKPFDLQPLFLKLIMDLTTAFALGESSEMLSLSQSEEKRRFVDALLYVKKIMARDGFLGPVHVLLSRKHFYKCCTEIHVYVERIIKKGLEKEQQPHTKGPEDGTIPEGYYMLRGLTKNTSDVIALRDGVITILIAGIDSVASLLSTTFFLLARDERVFKKLRESILDSVGQREPNYDQIKNLTYLRYVFNEAMRVFPPVPFNARTANTDTTLPYGGGPDGNSSVLVPKGQRVVFSSWASHRSFQTFGEDAHEFRPERWENIKAESLGYIPFNLGPRACPGQHYALAEASYVTVRMLQKFARLKNQDSRSWTENIGLNLSNANGVVVKLTRDSAE